MTAKLPGRTAQLKAERRQRVARACRLASNGLSDGEVAKALGVNKSTVSRYSKEPAYIAARALFRQRATGEAELILAGAQPVAAKHIATTIVDPGASEGVRLAAAKLTLELSRPAEGEEGVTDAVMSDDGMTIWVNGREFRAADNRPLLEAHVELDS